MKIWHKHEDDFIRRYFDTYTETQLSRYLGCTRNQVQYRIGKLGLSIPRAKTAPKAWAPSHVECGITPELILAVEIRRMVMGTYRRAV
jgi:hypothetical protein